MDIGNKTWATQFRLCTSPSRYSRMFTFTVKCHASGTRRALCIIHRL